MLFSLMPGENYSYEVLIEGRYGHQGVQRGSDALSHLVDFFVWFSFAVVELIWVTSTLIKE